MYIFFFKSVVKKKCCQLSVTVAPESRKSGDMRGPEGFGGMFWVCDARMRLHVLVLLFPVMVVIMAVVEMSEFALLKLFFLLNTSLTDLLSHCLPAP